MASEPPDRQNLFHEAWEATPFGVMLFAAVLALGAWDWYRRPHFIGISDWLGLVVASAGLLGVGHSIHRSRTPSSREHPPAGAP